MQGDIDGGQRDGVPTTTREELAALKAEIRRLRETNEILRRASVIFAGELDPRSRCCAGAA